MSLESKVKHIGGVRKVINAVMPFMETYDFETNAMALSAEQNIVYGQALGYLLDSYRQNKWLYRSAKVADTADKVTSILSAPIEALGTMAGFAPGWLSSGVEEVIEGAFKLPFFAIVAKNPGERHRLSTLIPIEIATIVPVAGDLYDALSNIYMKTASEIIYNDARSMAISQARRPSVSALPAGNPYR